MEDYLRFLEEEGKAEATIACYRGDLKRLEQYLGCPLDEASLMEIRRYTKHELVAQGFTTTTVARKCSAIRSYYTWAEAQCLVEPGLADAVVQWPAVRNDRQPAVLSPDGVRALKRRIFDSDRPYPGRDWLIAYSLLTTGEAGEPLGRRGKPMTRQAIWIALQHYGVTPRLLTNTWRATRAERGHSQVQVLR